VTAVSRAGYRSGTGAAMSRTIGKAPWVTTHSG